MDLKSIVSSSRLKVARLSFLNNKVRVCPITGLSMMLQICVHHFIRYIARAPATETDRPKVAAPVSLFQFGELLLKLTRTSTLQSFHKAADTLGGAVLDMHMDMVFRYNTLQYGDILGNAYLQQECPATHLDIATENRIPVLRTPYQMDSET